MMEEMRRAGFPDFWNHFQISGIKNLALWLTPQSTCLQGPHARPGGDLIYFT